MTERFARELTLDEQLNAQAFLELRARQVTRRALLLIILIPILTMIKVATIQFSFFLIPLYFFAFYLHSAIGVRIWRVKSGSRIVLWLRRFHRRDLRQFPFGTVLQSACMKIACPITIQDSTYELSWHALVARGAFVYLCAFLFATIVFISYQVSFVLLLELIRVRENAKLIITGVNLVLSVPIVLLVTYKLIRRACFYEIKSKKLRSKDFKIDTKRENWICYISTTNC